MEALIRTITGRAIIAPAAFAIVGLAAAAAPAQEVTLRAVSAFAQDTSFSRPFEAFVERVNAEGEGLVRIDYIGGPETMPPFEVGNAVQAGVVDIANVTSAFYPNLLPEGEALKLTELNIEELRQNGGWEFLNQLHNDKVNAWYLAKAGDGVPFHLYLTQPIEAPDLTGLTIRTTPVYRAFFTALGANLVQTAPGEVYTALERGVVDGYGWPIQGILDLGWHEQTAYRVDPGFYTVDVNILVNLDRWNALTEEQRAFLTEQALWMEAQELAHNPAINAEEAERQREAGIEVIAFEGEQRELWLDTAREAGWAYVEQVAPDNAARLRELLTD